MDPKSVMTMAVRLLEVSLMDARAAKGVEACHSEVARSGAAPAVKEVGATRKLTVRAAKKPRPLILRLCWCMAALLHVVARSRRL
jgi:hypothetical protein